MSRFASGLTLIIATALLRVGDKAPWYICADVLAVREVSVLSVFAMHERHMRDMALDHRPA